jgi:hypothetical protein
MKIDKLIPILFIWFFSLSLDIRADAFLFLESKLMSLTSATEPEYFDGNIILTYYSSKPTRHVAARFEHEDYRILHTYTRNENGVFFLVYPVPDNCAYLKYRITVDGLWMSDPRNPQITSGGPLDVEYSCFEVTERPAKEIINPEPLDGSTFRFVYRGRPGETVSVIGDFNNWDPYQHILYEHPTGSGSYQIILTVGPGMQHYSFMVDGVRSVDPYNPNRLYDKDGQVITYFVASSD